tara:strand:- start:185 stop:877 length:693 start_codon:yes stop_codon:yes gene_type:complete
MFVKKIITTMLLSFLFSSQSSAESYPNPYEIKSEFVQEMDSAATAQSREVALRRERLLKVKALMDEDLNIGKANEVFLKNLMNRYSANSIDELLLSVDTVPVGIIIAVAAKESKWGTVEPMEKARNPFGLRCFTLGCGVKDSSSDMNNVYSELKVFNSLVDAVRYFSKNINVNSEFAEFRKERLAMRERGEYLTSLPLAEHLSSFSITNESYGSELREIIHNNKLYYLDD